MYTQGKAGANYGLDDIWPQGVRENREGENWLHVLPGSVRLTWNLIGNTRVIFVVLLLSLTRSLRR